MVSPAYAEGRVPDWGQPAAFVTGQFLAFRCGHRKGLGQGARGDAQALGEAESWDWLVMSARGVALTNAEYLPTLSLAFSGSAANSAGL